MNKVSGTLINPSLVTQARTAQANPPPKVLGRTRMPGPPPSNAHTIQSVAATRPMTRIANTPPPKVLGRTYAPKVLGEVVIPGRTGMAARIISSGGGSSVDLSSNGEGYTQPADNAYEPEKAWTPMESEQTPVGDVSDFKEAASTTSELAVPAVARAPLSILDKLLAFLGLSRKSKVTAVMAGEAAAMASMSRAQAAESLVRRARDGDQNAMAMIVCVREAAARGNTQAAVSARLIREYCKAHPVTPAGAFGAEVTTVENTEHATAVQLSNGPELTGERIRGFVDAAGFSQAEFHSFKHGLEGRLQRNPNAGIQKANYLGRVIGHALKLQAVRKSGSLVSVFDRNVGWELGE